MTISVTDPRRAGQRPASPRPRVRVVPTPRPSAPRAPFVVVVLIVLIAGLGSLLLLNTLLAQGAFTVHDLTRQVAALQDREQALQQRVAALDAPRRLARRATAIGMVPIVNPAFLRVGDGRVLGVPEAAPGTLPTQITVIDPKESRVAPDNGATAGHDAADDPQQKSDDGPDNSDKQTQQSQQSKPDKPDNQDKQDKQTDQSRDTTAGGDDEGAAGDDKAH